jgi:hypothetical protein
MDRVFTADGPGVVTAIDTRQGTTWLCIEGAAFSGWYPGHEVTADIGDEDRYVTTPDDFPAPDKGAKLPYNPKPRDRFKDELNIQPTHDLNPNLTPTNSIDSIRNYEPNAVFGSHPFAKQRHARHFAYTETTNEDLELDFDHVPGNWSEDNPGLDDYGPDYDAKNPIVVNPQDGWVRGQDGKFHHPVKNAEFVEGYPEPGWNDIASPEELDNPFERDDEDEGTDDDDFYRTAAGGGMLNDSDGDNMSNSTLIDPSQGLPQQVPWDPSHSVDPEGGMQVYSPETDVAGQLQHALGEGGDELQGVEVPHQPDGEDELAGIPVPHIPGGGGLTPVGPGVEDPMAQVPEMPIPMGMGDADLAHMASEFMARTAGKNYSEGEQNLLMMEAGSASQLTSLNLRDSIYEDDEGSMLL